MTLARAHVFGQSARPLGKSRLPSIMLELSALQHLGRRDLFAGDTTPQVRCDRMRAELLKRELGPKPSGIVIAKRNYTWSQVFERLYGEPLIAPHPTQLTLGDPPCPPPPTR